MVPDNMFRTVQRYMPSGLAYLQNLNCFIENANKKFRDFEKTEGNLGSSITFDEPPRATVSDGLVAVFQPVEQLYNTLTVNKAKNASFAYTNQQWIFNLEPMDYAKKFGNSQVQELSSRIEADVAEEVCFAPFRFYGDGVTPINSFNQIASMLALYRNYGSPQNQDVDVYLSDMAVPAIVSTGLGQFVIDRNEQIAKSWMLGKFDRAEFFRSNQLPVHTAGTLGNEGTELTVVSTNSPSGANITQITCSGAGTDSDAVKLNDLGYILDSEDNSYPRMRYLRYIGHLPSENSVQFKITANAASSGGSVVLNIEPALVSISGINQNINNNITAGMKIKLIPNHRRGAIVGGDAFYLAMPKLPNEDPYTTVSVQDKYTGATLRCYYGSSFGQNQRGIVHDVIWGSKTVPKYCMAIVFPL